jgi:hypothetical protein
MNGRFDRENRPARRAGGTICGLVQALDIACDSANFAVGHA